MPTDLPILLGCLIAGLGGSLHCIGMCGPILVAATNVVPADEIQINGRPINRRGIAHRAISQLWYHIGRLMTYAMLGAIAGSIGKALQELNWFDQWQHYLGIGAAALAIAFGFVLLGLRFTRRQRAACANGLTTNTTGVPPVSAHGRAARATGRLPGVKQFLSRSFKSLAATQSIEGKLLLGALMGFLPCGLVYGALVLVAATANPGLAALGMVIFGLGTVPALSGVVVASGMLPVGVRKYGEQFAAIIIIAVGSFMLWRAWPHNPDGPPGACPMCDTAEEIQE